MANQIALKVHTRPLDEVVCDEMSHIYQYEVGGYAFHSGIAVNLLRTPNGILLPELVDWSVKPLFDWLPRTRLVVLENTCNKGGGSIYPFETIKAIREVCQKRKLALHIDGARIFNALVETGQKPAEIGAQTDSISVCLSKGLGAPVGSVLIGSAEFIAEARRVRKVMGGGMRQAGYLAAAGIYALDHHVERLKEDHENARKIATALLDLPYVTNIRPVESNILIFDLKAPHTPATFLEYLVNNGVIASAFGPQTIRFVTHLDVTPAMIDHTIEVLRKA